MVELDAIFLSRFQEFLSLKRSSFDKFLTTSHRSTMVHFDFFLSLSSSLLKKLRTFKNLVQSIEVDR